MEVGELRRLAIRLATHQRTNTREGSMSSGCCVCFCDSDTWVRSSPLPPTNHTKDCPIAELEAEEAASVKLSIGDIDIDGIADGTRVTIASGDGWSAELKGEWETVSFDLKDGTKMAGYIRMVTPEKPATKFEGEY